MKRRVKQRGSSTDPRRRAGVQREGTKSRWQLKRLLFAAFVIISVPVAVKMLPELMQHFVYTHRVSVPFFVDLSRPADVSLNHTVNMYLTSEAGISLGVWHTVPESRGKEAQGKELGWYENALKDGSPVFIYLHGNTGTRAAPHRVGVAKVLSALGYHVLVPDYRGFGDSTGEPTESGLTTDMLYLYNWVKARCGDSPVVVWGHSLGTGVATNGAVRLLDQGVVLDGVILEGAFNTARQHIPVHPFIWYYWKFPGTGYLFPEPWAGNEVVFPSELNLKKMKSPILFLHSEDDHLVPIEIARQMYEAAAKAQTTDRVKLVTFDGSLGYLHNGLYRDSKLPDIIKTFVSSL
ncbi:lysophosphatidylserine lipase ABHD12-like [Cololabis saira]|uniref:lysophosphatidylserine lipase ABHD12-like n=1 Tax=Cololabis saira TaxID=129043 RepID=UPI002AD54716|nr:lysophosphatidylserine lipase ABHD12-like [Cololabis saira]